MTVFQLLSDVHLRDRPYELTKASNADILLLAGDIGNACDPSLCKFLENAATMPFRHICMIRGNHEMFGATMEETDAYLNSFAAKIQKLVYLNRSTFDIPGTDLRIAGCTLWTKISDVQRQRVLQDVGDFKHIREWTLEKRSREHSRDVEFIVQSMNDAKRDHKRLIILTHHAPILKKGSAVIHASGPCNSSYECDLESILVSPIVAACFGHTHFSMKSILSSGVQLISNQRGRDDDVDNTEFSDTFTFRI